MIVMNKYKTGHFDIDHPILNVIIIIIKNIFLIILGFILFLIIMSLIILPQNNCYKGSRIFEYEDLNGNIGTAENCEYTDKQGYSGGMGEPVCFIGKKVIAVKWYEDKTEYGKCYKIILGGDSNE